MRDSCLLNFRIKSKTNFNPHLFYSLSKWKKSTCKTNNGLPPKLNNLSKVNLFLFIIPNGLNPFPRPSRLCSSPCSTQTGCIHIHMHTRMPKVHSRNRSPMPFHKGQLKSEADRPPWLLLIQ